MTRARWFCQLCGGMTARPPGPDGRAVCRAHSDLALDEVPPDPVTSLPLTAAELSEAVQAPEGKAI